MLRKVHLADAQRALAQSIAGALREADNPLILSGTSLCNFGGCTEAHQYRLFGLSFPAFGIIFFTAAGLLTVLINRFPWTGDTLDLLLAGAAGAEINMILLQK